MSDSIEGRRRELGRFLRAHRAGLDPAQFGFAVQGPGGRRRTPGLRREEVAQRAGVSTTWYAWIEQGRDVAASPAALSRLADSLRLSRAERGYLFSLAGKADPYGRDDGTEDGSMPESLRAAVAQIGCPAYVLDPWWNLLAWNAPAAQLFAGWLDEASSAAGTARPNLLRFMFASPLACTLVDDWAERARRVVAEFRIDFGRRLGDPRMAALVDELASVSPAFADAWAAQQVLRREGGRRRFRHPRWGLVSFDQISADIGEPAGLRLVMLVSGDPRS
ncbi:MAG: helix-turn-helix transcriptional regulator [Burkholderiaceae bacterium]